MRWSFFRIAVRRANRNKEQSIIKILGLGIGIAACLLIFLVIRFETSFDDFHPGRDRIFRVVSVFKTPQGVSYESGVPFPTGAVLRKDYPQMKQVASLFSAGGSGLITVGDGVGKFRESSGVVYAEPQFFGMFGFPWLAGDKVKALQEPNTVLLTRTVATKYFGDWSVATGRTVKLDNSLLLKVTGVLEDMPANTDFPLKVVISYATLQHTGLREQLNNWTSIFAQHYCFITLADGVSEAGFNRNLAEVVNRYKPAENRNEGMELLSFKDMHFDMRYTMMNNHPFSRNLIHTLGLIGLFVLAIACVNFVNLSTAQAVDRSREVGMRKVMGGTRRQLLWQFVGETAMLVSIATGLAVCLCALALPLINHLLAIHLPAGVFSEPRVILLLIGVALATTFLAGFYPAVVLSGFDPVTAFRNKRAARGTGSNLLRRVLVVLQFTISQGLIICVLVIIGQVAFFQSAPMGFDKDAILVTHMPDNGKMDLLRQQLMKHQGVEKVSFSFASPVDENNWNSDIIFNGRKQLNFGANLKWADTSYAGLYHLQLLAGHFYVGAGEMVVNEKFLMKLGIPRPEQALGARVAVGDSGPTGIITGVVKDFNIGSLHDSVSPVIMQQWKQTYSTVNIKLSGGLLGQTLPAIEQLWKTTFPDDVYEYRWVDERIAQFYQQEHQLSVLYTIFASLAVLVSCLGLYSLVSFMAVTRAREVGIRKTLGASVARIVYLFTREFSLLVLLGFVIAAPVAGYFMHQWLQHYAFHFQPGLFLFLEALGLSMGIAWISVGYRALRAALVNPVRSLKSE